MKIRRIIFTILSILWMLVIFFMSARDADTSTEDSHFVGIAVGNIIYDDFDTWTEEEQLAFADKVDFPIRKCAHATEYAILALFLSGAVLSGSKIKNKSLYLCILVLCILYAMSDELHQYFVPGRACRVMDVCIDSVGAFVGLCIATKVFCNDSLFSSVMIK